MAQAPASSSGEPGAPRTSHHAEMEVGAGAIQGKAHAWHVPGISSEAMNGTIHAGIGCWGLLWSAFTHGAESSAWIRGCLAHDSATSAVYRRDGPYLEAVTQTAQALGSTAVFLGRRYEPAMRVSAALPHLGGVQRGSPPCSRHPSCDPPAATRSSRMGFSSQLCGPEAADRSCRVFAFHMPRASAKRASMPTLSARRTHVCF